ncbi:hypothetical protein [Staphylococcus epidermidis]|uniref:hypothetical protein n=1 Tax=Staphylococcus epidermidis TaxID=1282 RepID=UPI001642DB3E|nr:hypothetical protein [Staphylococcus epidermidis]
MVKEELRGGRGKEDFIGEKDFLSFLGKFFNKKWEGEIESNMEGIEDGENMI